MKKNLAGALSLGPSRESRRLARHPSRSAAARQLDHGPPEEEYDCQPEKRRPEEQAYQEAQAEAKHQRRSASQCSWWQRGATTKDAICLVRSWRRSRCCHRHRRARCAKQKWRRRRIASALKCTSALKIRHQCSVSGKEAADYYARGQQARQDARGDFEGIPMAQEASQRSRAERRKASRPNAIRGARHVEHLNVLKKTVFLVLNNVFSINTKDLTTEKKH